MGPLRRADFRPSAVKLRGLVLAGGRSRRFGEDKALALYEGKTFVERAAELLTRTGLKTSVSTRADADYSFLKYPILRDVTDGLGPLGGLHTALAAYPETAFLVLTCDMPAVRPQTLERLIQAFKKASFLTLLRGHGEEMPAPFPGIYPSSLFADVHSRLAEGKRSMQGLIDSAARKNILFHGEPGCELANLNEKADLDSLVQKAALY